MIRNKTLQFITKEAIEKDGNIDRKLTDYILKNLSKEELKMFLRNLKKTYAHKNITVKHAGTIPDNIKRELEKKYADKNIQYIHDATLGGGIEIVDNDLVVNYTVSGLVKNNLKAL